MATEAVHIIDPSNAAGTDYTSLEDWLLDQKRNLVTADEIAVAKCCGGRDLVPFFVPVMSGAVVKITEVRKWK